MALARTRPALFEGARDRGGAPKEPNHATLRSRHMDGSKEAVQTAGNTGLIEALASENGLSAKDYQDTVVATCFKTKQPVTRNQFRAFCMVAREFDLNPILKQIHAFVDKGGAVIPIVGVDGWFRRAAEHPQCDGITFADSHDDEGRLVWAECTIHRKDRSVPTTVREYLVECYRPTGPWKMEHRMLRHRAAMQAIRVAFGMSGVYSEDEGLDILRNEAGGDVVDVQVVKRDELDEVVDEIEAAAADVESNPVELADLGPDESGDDSDPFAGGGDSFFEDEKKAAPEDYD
ncbi:MAG: recombinase RecT [Myxococcales bacterium FL481]|nr:MAG: recombinase RecT [Myxococcales bacterium FL481]